MNKVKTLKSAYFVIVVSLLKVYQQAIKHLFVVCLCPWSVGYMTLKVSKGDGVRNLLWNGLVLTFNCALSPLLLSLWRRERLLPYDSPITNSLSFNITFFFFWVLTESWYFYAVWRDQAGFLFFLSQGQTCLVLEWLPGLTSFYVGCITSSRLDTGVLSLVSSSILCP